MGRFLMIIAEVRYMTICVIAVQQLQSDLLTISWTYIGRDCAKMTRLKCQELRTLDPPGPVLGNSDKVQTSYVCDVCRAGMCEVTKTAIISTISRNPLESTLLKILKGILTKNTIFYLKGLGNLSCVPPQGAWATPKELSPYNVLYI